MTPKPKTDNEIIDLCFVIPRMALPSEQADCIRAWKKAESELLPIINQQQERIRELEGIIQRAIENEMIHMDNKYRSTSSILSEAKKGGE